MTSKQTDAAGWELRMLYDAECPLCAREVALLEWLDRGRHRVQFEDIADPAFDPNVYGLDQPTVEARLHAVLPDGRTIEGVDVFERAYAAVGLTWLAAPMRWKPIRWLLDRGYDWFARNRLALTGRTPARCDPEAEGSRCSIMRGDPAREA